MIRPPVERNHRAIHPHTLAERAGASPNAVSQQLRVLRHLRLVAARRDGRRVLYRLHDDHLVDLLVAIRHQQEHADRGWVDQRRDVPSPR